MCEHFGICGGCSETHSALSALNSSLGKDSRDWGDLEVVTTAKVAPTPKSPQSPQSLAAKQGEAAVSLVNTRIVCGEFLESQANSESSTSDSYFTSESTPSLTCEREPKQSTKQDSNFMDCHAGLTPARNDNKIESAPHASPESPADSENPSGGVYLHRDKNEIAHSRNLRGVVGGERYICERIARGEGATSPNSSPSPLDEKKTESNEVFQALEVKAGDSEKVDSESQKGIDGDSKGVDCHEAIASRNDNKTESLKATDSEKRDSHAGLTPARNDDNSKSPDSNTIESNAALRALTSLAQGVRAEFFPSKPYGYRARAEFRFIDSTSEGGGLSYAMSARGRNARTAITRCPILHQSLQALMPKLLESLRASKILSHKLYACNLLCSLQGEAIITLIYHKRLDSAWEKRARELQENLNRALPFQIHLIGRAKNLKLTLSTDTLLESLTLFENTPKARTLRYFKQEARFSQPNPAMNIKMLEFITHAIEQIYATRTPCDMLELYCGSGNFSIALSPYFRAILATEVVKSASALLNENLKLNHIDNITSVRLNAYETIQALRGERAFYRLKEVDIESYRFDCVLIDPPRAGVGERYILEFLQGFSTIIYVSCNPTTLLRDMEILHSSHAITHFGKFDQFPHTPHSECVLILTKR